MASQQKIAPLTSLRFFAAFLVVLYHTAPQRETLPSILRNLISIGFVPVSFFFMLSGYILSVVYLPRDLQVDRHRFWLARFARIYPLFFFSLLMDLPNLLLSRIGRYGWKLAFIKSSATLAGNAMMLQGIFPQLHSLNNPVWSLSVETIFYLLFPLLGSWFWRLSERKPMMTLGTIYLSGLGIVFAAIRFHIPEEIIKFNPIFHLHEFFAGVVVARWHIQYLSEQRKNKQLKMLAPYLAGLSLALFIIVTILLKNIPYLQLHDGLLIPIYAIAIVGFGSGNSMIDRIFSATCLVVPGEASYGLYLIHWPLQKYWTLAGLSQHIKLYPVYLVVTVATSIFLFYRFEIPARTWILHQAQVRSKETSMSSSIIQ